MASIGRIIGSAINGSFEPTVALANLNFDFTLIKVDAPREFAGVGSQLSTQRRNDAETGSSHVLARKLGALFRDVVPSTPELVKAYGTRASAIFNTTQTNGDLQHGMFASTVGVDGTSMWAAATSGKQAIACHLLACLLARIWDAPEAISYWIELIMRRKEEINSENEHFGDPALMVASQESFQREDLAAWDASARAWLRIADTAMGLKRTQLRLIMDNISIPVNGKVDSYDSIMDAWKSSLQQVESLLVGHPQEARDGAIILGLDAWHLYPDLIVLGSVEKEVKQNDPLFKDRGILTVGLTGERSTGHRGVYWSLPLRHLRHYGLPVTRKRSINIGEGTRITIDQFILVITSAYLRAWDDGSLPTESVLSFFAEISLKVHEEFQNLRGNASEIPAADKRASWPNILAESALSYVRATGPERKLLEKLWNLGKSHSPLFRDTQPFFNFFTVSNLLRTAKTTEEKIGVLREIARPFCDRYTHPSIMKESHEYATAFPQVKRTLTGEVKEHHTRWMSYETEDITVQEEAEEDVSPFIEMTWLAEDNPWAEHFAESTHEENQEEQSSSKPTDSQDNRQVYREALQKRKSELLVMGESVEPSIYLVYSEDRLSAEVRSDGYETPVRPGLYVSVIGDDTCQLLRLIEKRIEDKDDAIFKRRVADEAELFASKVRLTTDRKRRMFNTTKVSFQECARLMVKDIKFRLGGLPEGTILCGIAEITDLYRRLDGATVDVRSVKLDLSEARWLISAVNSRSMLLGNFVEAIGLDHAASFACIAMLETGSFNLDPGQLENVMALSAVDSLHVASCLLHDPSDSSHRFRIQRLTGNIGRAGVAFLVPPVEPMIKKYDAINEWQLLDYSNFDGRLENNFSSTSLQLSFTEATLPINVGYSGGVDTEAFFLESLISVFDSGQWVADIDVLKALKSTSVYRVPSCPDIKSRDGIPKYTSVDRFAEMLCQHDNTCIVRAWKNWQARLAATSICIANGHSVVVMCEEVCWKCVEILVDNIRNGQASSKVVVIS
ncbi:unnamed protein product [Penicillium pancosmium]